MAKTTLKEVCEAACDRRQLQKPAFFMGNSDPTAAQMVAMFGETLEDINTKWWVSTPHAMPDAQDAEVDFDKEALVLGVLWRYLDANGLDYAEPMLSYERRLHHLASQTQGTVNLA